MKKFGCLLFLILLTLKISAQLYPKYMGKIDVDTFIQVSFKEMIYEKKYTVNLKDGQSIIGFYNERSKLNYLLFDIETDGVSTQKQIDTSKIHSCFAKKKIKKVIFSEIRKCETTDLKKGIRYWFKLKSQENIVGKYIGQNPLAISVSQNDRKEQIQKLDIDSIFYEFVPIIDNPKPAHHILNTSLFMDSKEKFEAQTVMILFNKLEYTLNRHIALGVGNFGPLPFAYSKINLIANSNFALGGVFSTTGLHSNGKLTISPAMSIRSDKSSFTALLFDFKFPLINYKYAITKKTEIDLGLAYYFPNLSFNFKFGKSDLAIGVVTFYIPESNTKYPIIPLLSYRFRT